MKLNRRGGPWQKSSSLGGLIFTLESVSNRKIKLLNVLERSPVKLTRLLPQSQARLIRPLLWDSTSPSSAIQEDPVPSKRNWGKPTGF